MQVFTAEKDGFIGAYYGGPEGSRKAVILMLGDSATDCMAKRGAGWMIRNGCHALTMSAGVVVDTGGTLSHAAIVAREYGIPAVLAAGDATRKLKDGDMVLVDGTAGTVTVVA